MTVFLGGLAVPGDFKKHPDKNCLKCRGRGMIEGFSGYRPCECTGGYVEDVVAKRVERDKRHEFGATLDELETP